MPLSFERMPVWKKAHELTLFVYEEVVPQLPEDQATLGGEMTRASMSAGASLAGAAGYHYTKDRAHRCYEARALLYETINFLVLAKDLRFIPDMLYRQARGMADEAVQLLNDFIVSLKRK